MTGFRRPAPAAILAAAVLITLSACGGDAPQPSGPSAPVTTASTPSASPSQRALTAANLLAVADITSPDDGIKIEEVAAGRGRTPAQISICFPAGAADLGATSTLSRNFRFFLADPHEKEEPEAGGPSPGDPSIYTVAWQFADPAGAQQAEQTVRRWVADCRRTLAASLEWRPIRSGQNSSTFHPVKLSGTGQGAWAEVPLYRARTDRSDNGFFETVGLTRVADRLMVTIDLVYGMDKITSDQQDGDPDNGIPADPQFELVEAAAKRLAG